METSKVAYNPWPLPKDESLQRIELQQLKDAGYEYNDPREINAIFEKKLCEFTGAKYCVLTDSCTHAIELCLTVWGPDKKQPLIIPDNTYVSVFQTLERLKFNVVRREKEWSGLYFIEGSNIVDSAVRWEENMYIKGTLQCLSFQIKKPICIGRGGAILTDDENKAQLLRYASYDGRDLSTPYDDDMHVLFNAFSSFHYYMTPEDAARGILLMDKIKFRGDSANWTNYPSISKWY